MYTLSFALRSLPRNRGRYLLFGGILILLIAVCFVNLTLGISSDLLCETIKEEYGAKMRLKCYTHSANLVSMAEYDFFYDPELVEEMEIRAACCYFAPTVVSARTEQTFTYNKDSTIGHNLWFVGLNPDYSNLFNRAKNRVVPVEGRMYVSDDECVVTDTTFAAWKEAGLVTQIGDQVTLQIVNKLYDSSGRVIRNENKKEMSVSADVPLTIVGIVKEEEVDVRYQNLYHNKSVLFLTEEAVVELMRQLDVRKKAVSSVYDDPLTDLSVGYDVIYRLHDYRDAEKYIDHVRTLQEGLEQEKAGNMLEQMSYRRFGADQTHPEEYAQLLERAEFLKALTERQFYAERVMADFDQIVVPLEQSQSLTAVITAMIAMLAVMTVALMSVINMRERKYELGVLRCVGMSKGHISFTLGLESLIFLLITVVLGIALGFGFAALFGDAFVDFTIVDTTIDTLAISVDVAVHLIIAALALSIFATVISAAFVMRARPLAILRNRT